MHPTFADEIEANGFAVVGPVMDWSRCEALTQSVSALPENSATRKRGQHAFARRNLLELPQILSLANSSGLGALVDPILGSSAKPVRGILFDKHASANWVVPWHQDRSIAVRERIEVAGFGPWSEKAGVIHVQPPVDVLHRMVTLRIHLDRCRAEDGALRVIPGSHKAIWDQHEVEERVAAGPVISCEAEAGMVLIMRPLLLHSSLPATIPSHRRVIHLEYAGCDLPGGLRWRADRSQTLNTSS